MDRVFTSSGIVCPTHYNNYGYVENIFSQSKKKKKKKKSIIDKTKRRLYGKL